MSIALKQVFNKDKTFRPKRKFEPGTQRFELHKRAQASLNSGVDLKAAVQLPTGEDLNDWVAVHVVDFFNRINLIYGTICEFCTERTCPMMSGGPKYEYRWQDDLKYKKPTALPAPQYMNLLMDWIEVQINNEDIFPTSVGVPFPKNFLQICKKILCRLFRVFVHVYIHHFDRIIIMGAEAHVNTCYKHFYYFVTELNLIDRKELEPLKVWQSAQSLLLGNAYIFRSSLSAAIPVQHVEENERINDVVKLQSSLKALQEYVEELRITAKEGNATPEPENEPMFGPRYPSINVQEPPMDIPLEVSDKAKKSFTVKEPEPQKMRQTVLLIISTLNLLLLFLLTGCCVITIWLNSKNGRLKLFGWKLLGSTVTSSNFQTEDSSPVSSVSTIVDEAPSFSDESERVLDQTPGLAPDTPHPTVQPPGSSPEQAA
ncbi:MOB kinase activator 3B isoform 2-T4 [Liasis olivaceus]